MYTRYFILLCGFLSLKAIAIGLFILYGDVGLGPDEAQYWTWSRLLDWGYYSKPPGIAWEISLGTHLFGNTELGVRSMAILIGTAIPACVYLLAKNCRLAPSTCFWAAVVMAFSPLGILASFLAITDGGMVLFWTAACAYFVDKIERRELPNYLILGLLLLCGALFKWPTYFFWLIVGLCWIPFPSLRSWKVLAGICVSLLALLPSVYWNATHEWATFKHVFATLGGGHAKPVPGRLISGNVFDFFGSQAALVSPILFVLLLIAFVRMVKRRQQLSSGVLFCGSLSLLLLLGALTASIFMKMQGNWMIFAYPTAFVLLSWYACEGNLKWLIGGVALSVLLCLFAFSIPSLPISYRVNPFHHNVGWNALNEELKKVGYNPKEDFLFGDKYQMTSILSFYSEGQKRAYFFNLQGIRKNQFSFWPGMAEEQKGKRGFFVVVENDPKLERNAAEMTKSYEELLQPYFDQVKFLGIKPLFWSKGRVLKGALIFECSGFHGNVPLDPNLY